MKVFAVIRTRGPAWQPGAPLEDQRAWEAHAKFMDDLEARNRCSSRSFGRHAGCLDHHASSQRQDAAKQLAADPWTEFDLLRTGRIAPWILRLGTLPDAI